MRNRPPEIEAKARRVALVVLDADGVLTDGAITVFADGNESRNFFSRDGLGIRLGQRAGLRFAIISGRTSKVVAARAQELGFVACRQGVGEKGTCLDDMAREAGVPLEAVCYVGDDIVDLPALRRAGLAAAPSDADPAVRENVDWVTEAPGGRGSVREIIELILKAQGSWARAVAPYLEGR